CGLWRVPPAPGLTSARAPRFPRIARREPVRLARPEGLEGRAGLGEGLDGVDVETLGDVPDDGVAVARGGREAGRAVAHRADHLLPVPADRPDRPVEVDRAAARDDVLAREVLRGQQLDDAEREHRARARPTHVLDLDLD